MAGFRPLELLFVLHFLQRNVGSVTPAIDALLRVASRKLFCHSIDDGS